jgi:hypothetical protein
VLSRLEAYSLPQASSTLADVAESGPVDGAKGYGDRGSRKRLWWLVTRALRVVTAAPAVADFPYDGFGYRAQDPALDSLNE